jgi:hypothetical protein
VNGSQIANRTPYDRPNVFIVRRTIDANDVFINMNFPRPEKGRGTTAYHIDLL